MLNARWVLSGAPRMVVHFGLKVIPERASTECGVQTNNSQGNFEFNVECGLRSWKAVLDAIDGVKDGVSTSLGVDCRGCVYMMHLVSEFVVVLALGTDTTIGGVERDMWVFQQWLELDFAKCNAVRLNLALAGQLNQAVAENECGPQIMAYSGEVDPEDGLECVYDVAGGRHAVYFPPPCTRSAILSSTVFLAWSRRSAAARRVSIASFTSRSICFWTDKSLSGTGMAKRSCSAKRG